MRTNKNGEQVKRYEYRSPELGSASVELPVSYAEYLAIRYGSITRWIESESERIISEHKKSRLPDDPERPTSNKVASEIRQRALTLMLSDNDYFGGELWT